MEEITKHINDTNASYRHVGAGDAKNTDLFLDNEHYELFRDSGEQITVRFDKTNLTQAILFIASILPRKFDQSAIHEVIRYSDSFVLDQLAILDALFKVDGVSTNTITQTWNARKDVPQKNGKIDTRFYLNGLLQDVQYTNSKGENKRTKFTIRNYFAGGYSNLHIQKAEDGIFDIRIDNVTEPYNDGKEDGLEELAPTPSFDVTKTLQQIYYGAPGTGKSHEIKKLTKGKEVIRTTFHPDSDYSTFVGAYKPTTKSEPRYTAYGEKAVIIKDADGNPMYEDKIVYEFVSQAFLQAYVNAWKQYAEAQEGEQPKEQYLVIEEINRGNCAQIFGDLFQLLDRNDKGFSDYPIKADNDMKKQLVKAFAGLEIPQRDTINALYDEDDIVGKVLSGEVLLLPDNLYIWATMNTSDQSLFPIDSAFKRRWDWKYMPISNANKQWSIEVNETQYDWWQFVDKINNYIGDATHSEDKKLGYFFCKPKDKTINAETFVGKVIFYLWNDVFKDEGLDNELFQGSDGEPLTFDKFYGADNEIDEDAIETFLQNLKVDVKQEPTVEEAEQNPNQDVDTTFTRDHLRVTFPDGYTIEKNIVSTTLQKVVERIGAEQVASIGIKRSSYPLVALSNSITFDEPKDLFLKNTLKPIGDSGYSVITHGSTQQRMLLINKIANALNIVLKVEFVKA